MKCKVHTEPIDKSMGLDMPLSRVSTNQQANRKRARSPPDAECEVENGAAEENDYEATQKRTRAVNDEREVGVIPIEQAWGFEASLLPFTHSNNYDPSTSMFVLCAMGNMEEHYVLLCTLLPHLRLISPTLQILALTPHPVTHPSLTACLTRTGEPVPIIQVTTQPFLRLGLLHPMGGGKCPLDAIVVVDAKGRRRMVLPFGWGWGKYVLKDLASGEAMMARLGQALLDGVEMLEGERRMGL